jgi:hypothetical protein
MVRWLIGWALDDRHSLGGREALDQRVAPLPPATSPAAVARRPQGRDPAHAAADAAGRR